jgi:hypothetical protein
MARSALPAYGWLLTLLRPTTCRKQAEIGAGMLDGTAQTP